MMKKLLCMFAFMSCLGLSAQIITFEDIDAKEGLLEHDPVIDINGDGEISQEEAALVTDLDLAVEFIDVFSEIEFFTSLETLIIDRNFLQTLDLSNAPNLRYVDARMNLITEVIFFEGTTLFEYVDLSNNSINSDVILLDNPVEMELFDMGGGQATALSISNCPGIQELRADWNITDLNLDVGLLGNWSFRGNKIETFNFCDIQGVYENASVDITGQSDEENQPYPVVFYAYDSDQFEINVFNDTPPETQAIQEVSCESLSIEEVSAMEIEFLYNPRSNYLSVQTDDVANNSFILYNLLGQEIAKQVTTVLDVSGLSKGVYIAQYGTRVSKILIY